MNNDNHSYTEDIDLVYEDKNLHTGWMCPRCGRVIAPHIQTCPYCNTQHADEGLAPGEVMICDAL